MILAVASGKGGTGKTTLALSMAGALGGGTLLLDCDVEEPDAHLFLPGKMEHLRTVYIPVPQVDQELCDACGRCAEFCQYGAILSMPGGARVFPEICHGCGGCARICPRSAIREVDWRIGVIEETRHKGIRLVHGRLDVGIPMAVPLIRAVRGFDDGSCTVIIDAPPGTSCSAAAAVRNTDYVVLVAEPTPFGLHDFRLAVELIRHFRIPFGAVINRTGEEDAGVGLFCAAEKIPILAEIPEERRIAEAYSIGRLPAEVCPGFAERISRLIEGIPGLGQHAAELFSNTHTGTGQPDTGRDAAAR